MSNATLAREFSDDPKEVERIRKQISRFKKGIGTEQGIKVGLIIPDIHAPYEDKKVISIAMQIGKDLQPDYLIYGGDCFDAKELSHKYRSRNKNDEQGIYDTLKEIEYFKKEIYIPLREACGTPKIHWCGGNHDWQRVHEAIAEMPERAGILDLKKHFPDANICAYNDVIKIGKLPFTHGEYVCDAHAKKHVTNYGSSVAYFHTHTVQAYTNVTKSDGKANMGISLGCACKTNPDYMKNGANAWVLSVSVVYFLPNGNFNLYPIIITDGGCVFNGKYYT